MKTLHQMTVGSVRSAARATSPAPPTAGATPPAPPTPWSVGLRRGATLTAAITAVAALASCSGGGSAAPSTPSPSPSTKAPIVAASIAPTKPQRAIPADRQIVEVPALRKTVAMTGCKAAQQGWAGSGTAKNTSSGAKTYHILVFFTDKYSRTIDYAKTDVKVAAGSSAGWSASTTFTPPKGTQCVLRGLSETPAA